MFPNICKTLVPSENYLSASPRTRRVADPIAAYEHKRNKQAVCVTGAAQNSLADFKFYYYTSCWGQPRAARWHHVAKGITTLLTAFISIFALSFHIQSI